MDGSPIAFRPDASNGRLPASRERALVLAAQSGDPAARERLVEVFLPAIGSVARRYRSSAAVDRMELMQEGVVGLLRALDRFDPTLGTPFWAYASWWVRQAMQQLVAEMTRPVVLSDRALRQLARVKGAQRAHVQADRTEPSTAQLIERTGLSRAQIESLRAVERPPRSLEEPLGSDDDGASTFEELLADPGSEDAYEHVIEQLEVDCVRELSKDQLDDRERKILNSHYGIGCKAQTLREIAGVLGLSPERVRQIEENGLAKLRAAAEDGVAA
jgi:RNA polymerase sigma factor (sigma-70 family)